MVSLNRDMLIQNINQLMQNNGMTQAKLAEILGTSQSHVSKSLNFKEKQCFTLEQVVGIAQHFGVSIDWLTGNTATASKQTPRSIARFLTGIFENHDASYSTIEVEEEIYTPSDDIYSQDCSIERKKIAYTAIYFPSYWKVPTPHSPDDEAWGAISLAEQAGNDSRMRPVNDFLRKYLQIFKVHEEKGVDDDAYQVVVENYLSKLRDQ